MKNTQENLATLTIWSRNVTGSMREPPTCAWIRADIWRQDGAICSKNRKIVPYHMCKRIPRLTVSVPDYGSWSHIIGARGSLDLRSPSPLMAPAPNWTANDPDQKIGMAWIYIRGRWEHVQKLWTKNMFYHFTKNIFHSCCFVLRRVRIVFTGHAIRKK